MTTTFLAVGLSWHLGKRIPWLPIISALFVVLGGLITLYFQDPNAIIFADTLYYACIGGYPRYQYLLQETIINKIIWLSVCYYR